MLKLQEQINNDLKQAMHDKQVDIVSTLRMLIAALHNKEIALRQGKAVELSYEQVGEVIVSEIKKRQDSITAYEQGGRQDLANKEKKEVEILNNFELRN